MDCSKCKTCMLKKTKLIELCGLIKSGKLPNENLNYTNDDGETPLLTCCRFNMINMVKLIAEKGADVNIQNDYGETPLYIASSRGYNSIVVELLNYKANFRIKNRLY
jgi:ankyrin repeat protein